MIPTVYPTEKEWSDFETFIEKMEGDYGAAGAVKVTISLAQVKLESPNLLTEQEFAKLLKKEIRIKTQVVEKVGEDLWKYKNIKETNKQLKTLWNSQQTQKKD